MGIPTDPGYKLYVPDCFCWPSGLTPKKIFISFQGIKTGVYWNAFLPAAPNGVFILEWISSHVWVGSITGWTFQYEITTIQGAISAMNSFFYPGFIGSSMVPCVASYNNVYNTSLSYYWGGTAALMSRD